MERGDSCPFGTSRGFPPGLDRNATLARATNAERASSRDFSLCSPNRSSSPPVGRNASKTCRICWTCFDCPELGEDKPTGPVVAIEEESSRTNGTRAERVAAVRWWFALRKHDLRTATTLSVSATFAQLSFICVPSQFRMPTYLRIVFEQDLKLGQRVHFRVDVWSVVVSPDCNSRIGTKSHHRICIAQSTMPESHRLPWGGRKSGLEPFQWVVVVKQTVRGADQTDFSSFPLISHSTHS